MADPAELRAPTAVHAEWLDDLTYSALQLIADALVELAGFRVAAIGVVRDDGLLHTAVVSGSEEARERFAGVATPVAALHAELDLGDRWGRFTFVPAERVLGTGLFGFSAATSGRTGPAEPRAGAETDTDADADTDTLTPSGGSRWRPEDLLVALFRDRAGLLRATLSIAVPDDGRRPDGERRAVLERFAVQAERAVVSALDRAGLADRLRRAHAAREVIRHASRELGVAKVVEHAGDTLLAATGSNGLYLRAYTGEKDTLLAVRTDGTVGPPRPRAAATSELVGRELWRRQRVGVLYADELVNLDPEDHVRAVQEHVRHSATGSLLMVPLGVGDECVGSLTLVRSESAPRWTEAEMAYTFDLGADLGPLLLNALAYEREQRLASELRALDAYKNRLVTTVADELRRPLAAILADLDLISTDTLPAYAVRARNTMERTGERMVRLVEDMTLLARVGDPSSPRPARPVDLMAVVREVRDLTEVAVRERDLLLRVRAPAFTPVLAMGDPVELDRLVVNLVNNAVKYTPAGGSVTISLRHTEDRGLVELVVADDGIGIPEEEQAQVFTEFFRSSDPAARERPGTGLGLAIVDRIVRRHGGRIEVESRVGAGSLFRVLLPAAVV